MANNIDWTALAIISTANNAQRKAELDKITECYDKINQLQVEKKYAKTDEEKNYYTDLIALYQQKIDEFLRSEEVKKQKGKKVLRIVIGIVGLYIIAIIAACVICCCTIG